MKTTSSLLLLPLFGSTTLVARASSTESKKHSLRQRRPADTQPSQESHRTTEQDRYLPSSSWLSHQKTTSPSSSTLLESPSQKFPTDRIVNGVQAEAGFYPYFARLVTIDDQGSFDFKSVICGGALIGEEWIVTASHCLMDQSGRLRSNLYGWEISYLCDDSNNCGQAGRHIVRADEWLVPSEYNRHQFYFNDVAVSHLADRVDSNVPYAAPDDGRVFSSLQSQVDTLRCVGIGKEETGRYSDVVRAGDMTFLDTKKCEDVWNTVPGKFSDRVFCLYSNSAQVSATMSCPGDSGGPIISTQLQRTDGLDVVVGVVTGGENVPCHERTKPALCGQVSTFYSSLIRQHVCLEAKNRFGPPPSWCFDSSSIAAVSQSFRPRPPAETGNNKEGGSETLETCMEAVPFSKGDFRPKITNKKKRSCDKLRKKTKKGRKLCEEPRKSNAVDKCSQLCRCLLNYAN